MKKRVVVIASVLLIATMLGGCGHKMKENVTLTDRQCDILLSEDLPTDWNKLTASQRNSIQAIEEMLEYVENKYDKKFIYAGYRRADFTNADGEALLVYAEGDNPDTDCFTVERTDDGFEDNYGVILAADDYQKMVEDAVADYLNDKTYRVFTEVGKLDDEEGFPRGAAYIIIQADEISNYDECINQLENILYNLKGVDDLGFYFVKDTPIDTMEKSNWEDLIEDDNLVENKFSTSRGWRNR